MDASEATRKENVSIIKDYLESEFKDCEVKFLGEIGKDFNRDMVSFGIQKERLKYLVKATEEILEDNDPTGLADILKNWELAERIRELGKTYIIIITREGLKKELKR